jgi:predicted PurR-regulated permease PerM
MKTNAFYRITISIAASGLILWFGRSFFVPIAYALIIALVLYPLCRFFESKGFGKKLSIALPLVLLCLLFAGLLFLLSYELVVLSEKWERIQQQLDPLLYNVQAQLESTLGWTIEHQLTWLRAYLEQLSQNAGQMLSETANVILGALVNLIIIPVYAALILVYRAKLATFLAEVLPERFQSQIPLVLKNTVGVFSKYIRGMLLVYFCVGVLNSLGLWIIGVERPFLYGMITAVMTIIPYFGIVISALLPITFSWLETGSMLQPLLIVAVFALVQYLEANLIFPYVVGRFVKLNTLSALVAIFLGAFFWGVAGMILFLPFFAVFRLFSQEFPELKPWSKVLGDK